MKEIIKMWNECEELGECIAFGIVIVLGIGAWVYFCYAAPQWMVGTMALPMCFVITSWCGRIKREMEKAAKDGRNEYEESHRQMREEAAAIRNAQEK